MISGFNVKDITDDNISEKRILLRADYNVDYDDNLKIIDDFRIKQSIPTLKYLLERKNKLIIISHLGKPKERNIKTSLKPVADYLSLIFSDYKIILVDDFTSDQGRQQITNQAENEIIILENIRYYPEELKPNTDFAKKLASFAGIYVNNAFGESHRDVTTITTITKFLPSYAGLLLKDEIEKISVVFHEDKIPKTFIVGGAKISTKIKFINKILSFADNLLIAGEIANTILAEQGINIKSSLAESSAVDIGYDPTTTNVAKEIIANQKNSKCKMILPVDCVIAKPEQFDDYKTVKISAIENGYDIYDIGPETIKLFAQIIAESKIIVLSGPLGFIEKTQFSNGTKTIFEAIINNPDAISILGGGDTLTFLSQEKGLEEITHISTGGGAMLKFIESGTLVGMEAIRLVKQVNQVKPSLAKASEG